MFSSKVQKNVNQCSKIQQSQKSRISIFGIHFEREKFRSYNQINIAGVSVTILAAGGQGKVGGGGGGVGGGILHVFHIIPVQISKYRRGIRREKKGKFTSLRPLMTPLIFSRDEKEMQGDLYR